MGEVITEQANPEDLGLMMAGVRPKNGEPQE
jgi:hypothetical protein